jgi:hypothetical protein
MAFKVLDDARQGFIPVSVHYGQQSPLQHGNHSIHSLFIVHSIECGRPERQRCSHHFAIGKIAYKPFTGGIGAGVI